MKRNFLIRDAIIIDSSYICADVHNDFDLRGINIYLGNERVLFIFERNIDSGVSAGPANFILDVTGVTFLSMVTGALGFASVDVVEIGYKNPDDFDHDWLVPESKAKNDDHLFIRLVGDNFIRVHGSRASVSLAPSEITKLARLGSE